MSIFDCSDWFAWRPVWAFDRDERRFRWVWWVWVRRYHHTRGYSYFVPA